MFNIDWSKLDSQFAQHVLEQVNSKLQHAVADALQEQKDVISQLQFTSLFWGSTAPELQILSVQDGMSDAQLQQMLQKNTITNHHLPPASKTQEQQQPFDTLSMASSTRQSKILANIGSLHLGAQKKLLRSQPVASLSDYYTQSRKGAFSVHGAGSIHNQSHRLEKPATMESLQKPLLPTRICSMYKRNDKKLWMKRKSVQEASVNNLPLLSSNAEQQQPKGLLDVNYLLGSNGILLKAYICYDGNMSVSLACEFAVNVPVPKFITFPVSATLSHLVFEGELNIMYRGEQLFIWFERSNFAPHTPLKDFSLAIALGDDQAVEGGDLAPAPLVDKSKIETLVKQQLTVALQNMVVAPNVFTMELKL